MLTLTLPLAGAFTAAWHRPPAGRAGRPLRQSALHGAQEDALNKAKEAAGKAAGAAGKAAGQAGSMGSAVGGAVLGGLVGGPFGAFFGAQLGGSFGAGAQQKQAEKAALESMGVSPEMLALANAAGKELGDAQEGLSLVRDARESQRRVVETYERRAAEAMADATSAVAAGDDGRARKALTERNAARAKLPAAETSLLASDGRMRTMQANVAALEERALEVEALLKQSMAAVASGKAASALGGMAALADVPVRDPLLEKFKALEGLEDDA